MFCLEFGLYFGWSTARRAQGMSYDHTTVIIPHPIRTAKSSTVGPNQYCGGGPRGNLGCRMFFWPQKFFLAKKKKVGGPKKIEKIFVKFFVRSQNFLWGAKCSERFNFWFWGAKNDFAFFWNFLWGAKTEPHQKFKSRACSTCPTARNSAPNPTPPERTSLQEKKKKKKQTGKPRLNLTRSLQQGNSR